MEDVVETEPATEGVLKREDWIVIRTVMIINHLEWWLHDIKAVMDEEKAPDKFKLFLVDSQKHYYLPLQVAFPSEDGSSFLSITDYVNGLPLQIRNRIVTIQNHFGSSIESTVKWTVNFHK